MPCIIAYVTPALVPPGAFVPEQALMSAPVVIGESSAPRLARGMRLQFDKQRDQWIIQAPERVFVLDAIAHEIVQRCDRRGHRHRHRR